jgi:hypothetical protein
MIMRYVHFACITAEVILSLSEGRYQAEELTIFNGGGYEVGAGLGQEAVEEAGPLLHPPEPGPGGGPRSARRAIVARGRVAWLADRPGP